MPNQQPTQTKLAIQNFLIKLNYNDRRSCLQALQHFLAKFNSSPKDLNLMQILDLVEYYKNFPTTNCNKSLINSDIDRMLFQKNPNHLKEKYGAVYRNNVLSTINTANEELNQVLNIIKHSFSQNYANKEAFFQAVLGSDNYDKIKTETLENGFKALQKAYPNGEINDNFQKVQQDETFKDTLKIILIVCTLGIAAYFDFTTLQSTHKKNYESFANFVNEQKQNAEQSQNQIS